MADRNISNRKLMRATCIVAAILLMLIYVLKPIIFADQRWAEDQKEESEVRSGLQAAWLVLVQADKPMEKSVAALKASIEASAKSDHVSIDNRRAIHFIMTNNRLVINARLTGRKVSDLSKDTWLMKCTLSNGKSLTLLPGGEVFMQ